MKGWLCAVVIGCAMLLSGCGGVLLVGAGVGAGAFSYIAGNLTRVYEVDYQLGVTASTTVMERLDFRRKEESEEGLKTVIEGFLDYDTPVTLEVVFVEQGATQIGVRTGYIGSDNLERSEKLHADIAAELERLAPPTLQATAGKQRISDPPALQATARKRKVDPAETGPRSSRTLYDNLPPPPVSVSPTSGPALDVFPSDFEQPEMASPAESETEREIMEMFQSGTVEQEDIRPFETEPVSTTVDDGSSDRKADEPEQLPTASAIETAPDIMDPSPATAVEKETDVVPPTAEPVSVPLDSSPDQSMDEAEPIQTASLGEEEPDIMQEIRESAVLEEVEVELSPPKSLIQEEEEAADDQQQQELAIPEQMDKRFLYHPESERTIHLGPYRVLDEVIAYLDHNPSTGVDIRAYTASSEDNQRELALTRKRLFEIRNYFILNGIAAERISAQGVGEGENRSLEIHTPNLPGSQKHTVEMIIR